MSSSQILQGTSVAVERSLRTESHLVDLTMPLRADMPFNPDHFPPVFSHYAEIASHGWAASRIVLDSHLGTHVDAPCHFIEGAVGLDQIPLDQLVGPAQVVHLTGLGDKEQICPDRLPRLTHSKVLISTGWWRHIADETRYFQRFPVLTVATARTLLDAGVRLLGIDTPSPDRDGRTHIELLRAGAVIVENLVDLEHLPTTCTFLALPLPIVGGDGSPVRAVAVVDQ